MIREIYMKIEDQIPIEKMSDKIFDREFIKECESNEVIYEDEGSNENINEDDFLNFNEEDLTKIQIYKEIFDKPLSLR